MKARELRDKNVKDLNKDVVDLLREQFKLRLQKANDQLSRHTQLKSVRRDIARLKTVLNEKKGSKS